MAEKKKKRRKKSPKKKSSAKIILAAVAVVMLLLIAAESFAGLTVSEASQKIKTFFGGIGAGDGYPYSFASDSPEFMDSDGNDLILISDIGMKRLDSTAKIKANVRHSYSNPAVSSNNGVSILYDIGKDKYRIVNGKDVSDEKTAAGNILVCDMGKNGSFAVASRGANASSSLSVYNRNFKEVFKWNSSSDHIIDVALSDNCKKVAVSALGVTNGEVYSVIHIFNINGTEPLASHKFSGSVVANIDFTSKGLLTAAGDNVFAIISKDGSEELVHEKYPNGSLKRLDSSANGDIVIVYSKFGGDGAATVKFYTANGKESAALDISDNVKWATASNKGFALLSDSDVIVYGKDGSEKQKIAVDNGIEKIFLCGTSLYASSTGEIVFLGK